jgi:pyruvate/2-oxoglutarate/acetoin dehydrogenase E1 component
MAVELSYHEARTRAVFRELDANVAIQVLTSSGLLMPFNPDIDLKGRYGKRVMLPPISEFATLGIGLGAAIDGVRTLVAVTTATFMYYGWSVVVAEAPTVRYLSGGQVTAPLAIHIASGSRRGGGAQHEGCPQSMLHGIPGLKVFAPGTPAEVDAAVHIALKADDPTVIVDHILLANCHGVVGPKPPDSLPITMVRAGADVVVVAYSLMVQRALEAAAQLTSEGLSVAVLSVPQLNPLPVADLIDAVADFRAAVFLDEAPAAGSCASTMMSAVLSARVGTRARIVAAAPVPVPHAPDLVDAVIPSVERIATEIRTLAAAA